MLTSSGLSGAVAGAQVEPNVRAPAAALPFSLTGKITKITIRLNQVTVIGGNHHFLLTTSSSTVIRVKSKIVTLKKLKVGERVRVTGKSLGPLLLALSIGA
jgi:hypothetical protein